jgi:hypothetical protein
MSNQFDHHVREALQQTIHTLLRNFSDPDTLIAPHIWRDSDYLGIHNGKVVVWRGWRAKLETVSDGRYRTLYIDKVDNVLPTTERQRLFGKAFSQAVAGLPQFVVLFVLDFPLHAEDEIIGHGFVPRRLSRVLHACLIMGVDDFLATPITQLAGQAAQLLQLQSRWDQRREEKKVRPLPVKQLFNLRFDPQQIMDWSNRYSYPGEEKIAHKIVPRIRDQGYCTAADFIALCEWKSPRIRSRCIANDPAYVKTVTQTALSTPSEQLRIEVLTLLSGVSWPMASVILHWCHAERYPILDFRALWSLGYAQRPTYNFEIWWAYTQFCRELAHQAGVSMRTLDRALWQYSKENQTPGTND